MALVGAVVLFYRRVALAKIRVVTTPADWVVLALLIVRVALGLMIRIYVSLGSNLVPAYGHPWVVSLATFQPAPQYVSALPLLPKLHFLNATLLRSCFFQFTRLVHMGGTFTCQLPLAKFPIGNLDAAQSQLGESHVE